jgi:hypothetical protein
VQGLGSACCLNALNKHQVLRLVSVVLPKILQLFYSLITDPPKLQPKSQNWLPSLFRTLVRYDPLILKFPIRMFCSILLALPALRAQISTSNCSSPRPLRPAFTPFSLVLPSLNTPTAMAPIIESRHPHRCRQTTRQRQPCS